MKILALHLAKQEFPMAPPKLHGRVRIGLPELHGRIRIGLPELHRRFRIDPPQVFHSIWSH